MKKNPNNTYKNNKNKLVLENLNLSSYTVNVIKCNKETKELIIGTLLNTSNSYLDKILIDHRLIEKGDKIRIGISFAEPEFIPELNIVENMKLFLSNNQLIEVENLKKVFKVKVESKQTVFNCNLRELQMLSIIRALVDGDKLVVIDEPFENMQKEVIDDFVGYLKELSDKLIVIFDNTDLIRENDFNIIEFSV